MVVVVDVNSDGKPDVIAANGGSGNVSVYLGDGKGQFSQPSGSPFAAGQEPNDIATADFNGDGKLDLAVASFRSFTSPQTNYKNVTILRGNGDGTFQTPQTFATGSASNNLAVADLNADGKLDLVVDNYNTSTASVLLGVGNGTFMAQVKYNAGFHPIPVALGDINGDGVLDVLLTTESTSQPGGVPVLSTSVAFYVSSGTGALDGPSFVSPTLLGNRDARVAIDLGDCNGDGVPDIAAGWNTGGGGDRNIRVLFGGSRKAQ
jgi:hypothetical protein